MEEMGALEFRGSCFNRSFAITATHTHTHVCLLMSHHSSSGCRGASYKFLMRDNNSPITLFALVFRFIGVPGHSAVWPYNINQFFIQLFFKFYFIFCHLYYTRLKNLRLGLKLCKLTSECQKLENEGETGESDFLFNTANYLTKIAYPVPSQQNNNPNAHVIFR